MQLTHLTSDASPWIQRWAHLVPAGARLLDLACGSGRHARYFAARGALVDAVDRDAGHDLAGVANVRFLQADLEGGPWPYAGRRFDAIVVTNYLHRPLMSRLVDSLAPAGVLLYETFAQGNARFGKPSNPDFLLAPGELLTHCAGLHVLGYEDGVIGADDGPKRARVQRVCALAGAPVDDPARLRLPG
jgi:SAM-dependent methyltransferase